MAVYSYGDLVLSSLIFNGCTAGYIGAAVFVGAPDFDVFDYAFNDSQLECFDTMVSCGKKQNCDFDAVSLDEDCEAVADECFSDLTDECKALLGSNPLRLNLITQSSLHSVNSPIQSNPMSVPLGRHLKLSFHRFGSHKVAYSNSEPASYHLLSTFLSARTKALRNADAPGPNVVFRNCAFKNCTVSEVPDASVGVDVVVPSYTTTDTKVTVTNCVTTNEAQASFAFTDPILEPISSTTSSTTIDQPTVEITQATEDEIEQKITDITSKEADVSDPPSRSETDDDDDHTVVVVVVIVVVVVLVILIVIFGVLYNTHQLCFAGSDDDEDSKSGRYEEERELDEFEPQENDTAE